MSEVNENHPVNSNVKPEDFFASKLELKEIVHQLQTMQTAILQKLSGVIILVGAVSFFAFDYINDKRLDLMTEQHNARFEKLETTVFTPASDVILNEIRSLREDYQNLRFPQKNISGPKKKNTKRPRK